MIKIGTVKEMDKIKTLPIKVVEAIKDSLVILDEAYGAKRNIEGDLGGFILVIENKKDIEAVKKMNLDIYKDIPEYVDKMLISSEEMWVKALFLLSNDYAVVIVGKESIIQMNKLNF